MEIDYQTRFWYLPGALKGLVFNANYTMSTSQVKYPTVITGYFDFDTVHSKENNDVLIQIGFLTNLMKLLMFPWDMITKVFRKIVYAL